MTEHFSNFNEGKIEINANKKKIKATTDEDQSVYGSVVIPLPSTQQTIYEWKFKTTASRGSGYDMCIGIDQSNMSSINGCFHFYKGSYGYAHSGTIWKNGIGTEKGDDRYFSGDIITMTLNGKTETLSFSRRRRWADKKMAAFKIKNTSIGYRMAVHLRGNGQSVKLIKYSEFNYKQDAKVKKIITKDKEAKNDDEKKEINNEEKYNVDLLKARTLMDVFKEMDGFKQVLNISNDQGDGADIDDENVRHNVIGVDESHGDDSYISPLDFNELLQMNGYAEFEESEESDVRPPQMQNMALTMTSTPRNINYDKTQDFVYQSAMVITKRDSTQKIVSSLKEQNKQTVISLKREIESISQQMNEFKHDNLSKTMRIISMEKEIESLRNERDSTKKIVIGLKTLNGKLLDDIYKLLDDNKELELDNNSLRREVKELRMQCIDCTKYEEWDHSKIAEWILSLEDGRYLKYQNILEQALLEEGIKGIHLKQVNILDIKGWGIKLFEDKKTLMSKITELVNQNRNKMIDEGVPTAYI